MIGTLQKGTLITRPLILEIFHVTDDIDDKPRTIKPLCKSTLKSKSTKLENYFLSLLVGFLLSRKNVACVKLLLFEVSYFSIFSIIWSRARGEEYTPLWFILARQM